MTNLDKLAVGTAALRVYQARQIVSLTGAAPGL
jgi:hypothetical protein